MSHTNNYNTPSSTEFLLLIAATLMVWFLALADIGCGPTIEQQELDKVKPIACQQVMEAAHEANLAGMPLTADEMRLVWECTR